MLNGIVSGAEKAITRIPMQVGGVYKEGWEVRDSQDRIIWGREDELQTATGTLPFKGYGLPVKVKSFLGNTQQTGTPTPDAPIMPEFVGVRTGNLFDDSNASMGTWINNDGSTIPAPYAAYQSVVIGQTTNFIIKYHGNRPYSYSMAFYDSNGDFISRIHRASPSSTYDNFIVPEGAISAIIQVACVTTKTITIAVLQGYKLMLNSGSTALPYEPYGYKIQITNAGQTTPVYLGQTPTVRRVKKRVFDGSENWTLWVYQTAVMFYTPVADGTELLIVSSHFGTRKTGSMPLTGNVAYNGNSNKNMLFRMLDDTTITTVEDFKAWLAAQYAAGTPVTVWYILAEPTTGIVNEPLAKIGDYADELNDAVATLPEIPTTTGQNTLTVGTTLAPSEMTVKGHIKPLS